MAAFPVKALRKATNWESRLLGGGIPAVQSRLLAITGHTVLTVMGDDDKLQTLLGSQQNKGPNNE
jgi:hypothetical protein